MKICLSCGERFRAENWTCPCCGRVPFKKSGYLFLSPEDAPVDSYNSSCFSSLAEIEENHWWFRARRRLVTWALRRHLFPLKSFFEIGCGTGFMISGVREAFPTVSVFGSDLLVEGLAYASQRLPDASFFQMDARRIPFEEEFDVIGAFDVLEHIGEDDEVLAQVFRAVKPGGGMVITVPHLPSLWSEWDRWSHHKRRYTRNELVQRVKKAGFEDVWCTSFVSLLLPAMFLNRLRKPQKDIEFDPAKELTIAASLNAALLSVMSVEFAIIRTGIRFPLGGSLLLTAKRL